MDTILTTNQLARRLPLVLIVVLLGVIAVFAFAPPLSFEVKAKSVAYGICHQIPARSFFLAGHQLPLCARNTGIFLGTLLTFAGLYLTGKRRFTGLPPVKILIALGLFTVVVAVDGVNSYASFFPGAPQLYESSNFLRLVTGAFQGITMGMIMFPMFNSVLWRDAASKPVVATFKELALFVALALGLIAVVYAQLDFLYYPIALLMVLAVLVMVGMVNATWIAMVLRRENTAATWRDTTSLLLLALVASLIELALLGYARAQLTIALNLPF